MDRMNRMDRILSSAKRGTEGATAEGAENAEVEGRRNRRRTQGEIFDRINRMDRILSSAESAGGKEEGTQRRGGTRIRKPLAKAQRSQRRGWTGARNAGRGRHLPASFSAQKCLTGLNSAGRMKVAQDLAGM